MNIDRIVERVKSLGFTAYEAKAYISLLQNSPVTRYELSKNSGVPRSAIYDVIRKLETIGAVNGMYTEPEKYVPLPPDQLFELLERQFKERISEAKSSLKNYDNQLEAGHLWNIVGYKNMIHKAREMVGRSEAKIFISLWEREAQQLRKELIAAANRGVKITVFSFTTIDLPSATIFSYHIPEEKLEKIWDHKMILVVDQNELLMGEADNKNITKTAWTTNKAIVDIATNHIILDITLFGLRMNMDVGNTVLAMQNTGFEHLDNLLNAHSENNLETLNSLKG